MAFWLCYAASIKEFNLLRSNKTLANAILTLLCAIEWDNKLSMRTNANSDAKMPILEMKILLIKGKPMELFRAY